MSYRYPLLVLIFFFIFVRSTAAQQDIAPLAERLDALIAADPAAERMHVGVLIVDAESGDVLYARNDNKLFTPASNGKLYSSAFALDVWGQDRTFETTASIQTNSAKDFHRLTIRGGGDPVLTSSDLRSLVDVVMETVEADDAVFGIEVTDGSEAPPPGRFMFHYGPGWMWDDFPYTFSMPVTRLMVDYNTQTVRVQEGIPRDHATAIEPLNSATKVWFDPRLDEGGGDRLEMERHAFEDQYIVVPDANGGSSSESLRTVGGEFAVARPLPWIRSLVETAVKEHGHATTREKHSEPLAFGANKSHPSPPLSEILALFNKPSENAIGEMLLLGLGEELEGEWSWPAGQKALRNWLEEAVGLPGDSFRLVDGSGLSRYNLITPRGTVQLLTHMWNHSEREVYLASLPVAGIDGTLSGRMKNTPAEGKIMAKTGTMSGVSCLSGYAMISEEQTLVFSILTNGYVGSSYPTRSLQDRLCVALFAE